MAQRLRRQPRRLPVESGCAARLTHRGALPAALLRGRLTRRQDCAQLRAADGLATRWLRLRPLHGNAAHYRADHAARPEAETLRSGVLDDRVRTAHLGVLSHLGQDVLDAAV